MCRHNQAGRRTIQTGGLRAPEGRARPETCLGPEQYGLSRQVAHEPAAAPGLNELLELRDQNEVGAIVLGQLLDETRLDQHFLIQE